ncbi:MAG: ornithine cyclodeaminase family protein [Planctomycetia bacterium]|nr:ornithine cyclodeaminase family protein [Planctomycetia bacterium]
MSVRILSAKVVTQLLPMAETVALMRRAFLHLADGSIVMPERAHLASQRGVTLVMPAYVPAEAALSVKIVSVYPGNAGHGLPVICGVVALIDDATGRLLSLLDASSLTAVRTGAVGGLAADVLARPDAAVVALFGAGVQARTQLQAVLAVRPIRQVFLCSRTPASAERLAGEITGWPSAPVVAVVDNPAAAVRHADIVITATTSATPVFDGNDLQPGTHVTAIGSFQPQVRELDTTAVQRARIVVDSRPAAMAEAGDLIQAGVEYAIELGEILTGKQPGRENAEQITLFKSVGLAIQDAVAARFAFEQAEKLGLGTSVEF